MEYPNIMATPGLCLSLRFLPNLFNGQVVHRHGSVVLAAPLLSHSLEPRVELGHKMGPFCNSQCSFACLRPRGADDKRPETCRCQPFSSRNALPDFREHTFYRPETKYGPGIANRRGLSLAYNRDLIATGKESGPLQAIEVCRESRIERLPVRTAYLI
jgi:hypothetical protein